MLGHGLEYRHGPIPPTTVHPNPAGVRVLLGETVLHLQVRFDLLDVYLGWRPAARLLLVRGGRAESAATLCVALGLVPVVDPALVWQARPSPGSPYVDHLSEVAGGKDAEALVVLFVGRTGDAARAAMAADRSADDGQLGVALGYPPCCIRSVGRHRGVPTLVESLQLYASDGCFDPLLWPAAALNDAGLLPHYPCGVGCMASRQLASARLRELGRHGPPDDVARVHRTARAWFGLDDRGQVTMRHAVEAGFLPAGWVRPRSELLIPESHGE